MKFELVAPKEAVVESIKEMLVINQTKLPPAITGLIAGALESFIQGQDKDKLNPDQIQELSDFWTLLSQFTTSAVGEDNFTAKFMYSAFFPIVIQQATGIYHTQSDSESTGVKQVAKEVNGLLEKYPFPNNFDDVADILPKEYIDELYRLNKKLKKKVSIIRDGSLPDINNEWIDEFTTFLNRMEKYLLSMGVKRDECSAIRLAYLERTIVTYIRTMGVSLVIGVL